MKIHSRKERFTQFQKHRMTNSLLFVQIYEQRDGWRRAECYDAICFPAKVATGDGEVLFAVTFKWIIDSLWCPHALPLTNTLHYLYVLSCFLFLSLYLGFVLLVLQKEFDLSVFGLIVRKFGVATNHDHLTFLLACSFL